MQHFYMLKSLIHFIHNTHGILCLGEIQTQLIRATYYKKSIYKIYNLHMFSRSTSK
jgi:hypothetical protein